MICRYEEVPNSDADASYSDGPLPEVDLCDDCFPKYDSECDCYLNLIGVVYGCPCDQCGSCD